MMVTPVIVFLSGAHPREALETLSGEDAAYNEVAVAHVQLSVDGKTQLLLKLWGYLNGVIIGLGGVITGRHNKTWNIVDSILVGLRI